MPVLRPACLLLLLLLLCQVAQAAVATQQLPLPRLLLCPHSQRPASSSVAMLGSLGGGAMAFCFRTLPAMPMSMPGEAAAPATSPTHTSQNQMMQCANRLPSMHAACQLHRLEGCSCRCST
jgi:hypothetical protein